MLRSELFYTRHHLTEDDRYDSADVRRHVFVLITLCEPGAIKPLDVRSSQLSNDSPLSIRSIVMQFSTGQTSEQRLQPTQWCSSTRGMRSSSVTALVRPSKPSSSFGIGVVEKTRADSASTIPGVRVVSGIGDVRSR